MASDNPLSHVVQHPIVEAPADLGILTPHGRITILSDQIVMMIVAGLLLTMLVPVLVRRRAGSDAIGRLVPTEWVLLDVRIHAVRNGFGHGDVHLWADDGTLLATASQSTIVRYWREDLPGTNPTARQPPPAKD